MMITKPAKPQLAVPCRECGKSVPILNDMAYHLIVTQKRGTLCDDCREPVVRVWTRAAYDDYLKSEHWQSFRSRVLAHYGRKCYLCGTEDGQIDIHHNDYSRLGCEKMSDVIPLCHVHHEMYEVNK